jgi:hypothetical protein
MYIYRSGLTHQHFDPLNAVYAYDDTIHFAVESVGQASKHKNGSK